MKKIILFVSMIACGMTFHAQENQWEMVWNDEFDTDGLPDETKWSFDTEGNQWDWGNSELQNYTPADKHNAWVENGTLVIEARRESYYWPGDGQTRDYTSARLRTKDKGDWTYGKFEIKALLPSGRGIWPAIWMLATDEVYGGWPKSGELDIMENVGFDPDKVHFNIHCESYNGAKGNNKGTSISTSTPSKNWHVYGMEWDEESTRFFLDGNLIFTYANPHQGYQSWPYDKRFHLLLNVAVGGSWGGQQGVDDSIFPQRMLVDYVRVYQKKEDTSIETLQNAKEILFYPTVTKDKITIDNAKGENIKIFTMQGCLISELDNNEEQLTLYVSDLMPGTYLVSIGEKHFRFVKE